MSFTLYVDEPRWRAHLDRVAADNPGLVPVAKGNGYGFGIARLGAEAARLDTGTLAIGTTDELDVASSAFAGDVLVLSPAFPAPSADASDKVIHTVSHLSALRAAGGARVVLELMTSMRRHGLRPEEFAPAAQAFTGVRQEGLAVHLPMDRHGGYDPVAEVTGLLRQAREAGLPLETVWVSHLTKAELSALRTAFPETAVRPRIGTALWLGDRGALVARGTVLDVHPIARGERYGYRRRRATRDCHLVVVGGGTAHGVALEAPRTARGLVGRGKELAVGTLAAANLSLSPFRWQGKQRWFAEPPQMHVSLLLLPADVTPPRIGEELDCQVRLTTIHPDRVAPLPAGPA